MKMFKWLKELVAWPPDHDAALEEIKDGKLLKATPEQIERCKAHIRNRESLLPPDHEMPPEEELKKHCYCDVCKDLNLGSMDSPECKCINCETFTESTKEDHDKCQLDIINPAYLEDLADILTEGERKYDVNNWKGLHFSRVIAAMLRHMTAIQKGEDIDPDSGHPHAAHIAANAMFLHWWQANGFSKGKQDDRRWAWVSKCLEGVV